MSIARFLDELDAPEHALVVVNREAPAATTRLLEDLFDQQPVAVSERSVDDAVRDAVLLVRNGDVVASSPVSELMQAILMVNSDLYITGSRELEDVTLPDVLAGLQDVPLRLRGYPESHREKLLLITVSRYIERRALLGDGGVLRAAFQRLSRIEDEAGTRTVYDRLGASGTDIHVYGVPDWVPPQELGATIHAGYDDEIRSIWFVVYVPPDHRPDEVVGNVRDAAGPSGDTPGPAALVAVEDGPNEWEGFWTHRPELVTRINEYVVRNL